MVILIIAIALIGAGHCLENGYRFGGIALAAVGALGVGALLTKLAKFFRETSAYCDAWRARTRQSDEEFLAVCGVSRHSESAKLALTVRFELGEAAAVAAETIHADDSLRDRIWDCIDMLDIHLRIESAANVKVISNWVNESFREMRDRSKLNVSDFVRVILESTVPMNKPLAKGVYYGTNRNPAGTEIRRP